MTYYDNNIFENIRSRVTYEDIKRILPEKYVPKAIRRNTNCPFCNSSDGFGWFTIDNQTLSHCFSCEEGGDIVKVFAVINSLANIDSAKHIADTIGIQYDNTKYINKSYNFKVDRIKDESFIDDGDLQVIHYKKVKKIDLKKISKCICIKGGEYGVPMKSINGRIQGMQRLRKRIVENSKMKGGLFYERLSMRNNLYVVEGVSDYLTLKYIGIENVVGLPSANFNKDMIVSFLSRFRNVTVILDADDKPKEKKSDPTFAGMKASKKLKNAMGRSIKVKFIESHDGEDVSDAYVSRAFECKDSFESYVSSLREKTADEMMRLMGGAQKLTDVIIAEDMTEQTSIIIINCDLYGYSIEAGVNIWTKLAKGKDLIESFINGWAIDYLREVQGVSPTGGRVSGVIKQVVHIGKQEGMKYDIDMEKTSDYDNGYLFFQSKKYSVKTQQFSDYEKDDMALKYMPDIKNKKAECPVFDEALKKCFTNDGNAERKIDAIWRFISASLYSDHPFQYMYYFWGDGGDGKSIISEVISYCVGFKNTSSVTLKTIAVGGYGLSDAVSSNINISSEATNPDLFMSENIKAITGGDSIEVRQIHQAPQYVRATCKILVFTNKFPKINDDDTSAAGTRRFIPIAFTYNFTKDGNQDIKIRDKMKAERDGIIMKALSKMNEYLKTDMIVPMDIMDSLQSDFQERRAERSGVMEFFLSDYIRDRIYEFGNPAFYQEEITASELYRGFMDYQKDYLANKYRKVTLTLFGRERRKLISFLANRGIIISEERTGSGLMIRYELQKKVVKDDMNGFKIINNK